MHVDFLYNPKHPNFSPQAPEAPCFFHHQDPSEALKYQAADVAQAGRPEKLVDVETIPSWIDGRNLE